VSFEEATFVEPVNTCLKAFEKARIAPGDTVVVMGQGPVGLLLMMLPVWLAHRSYQRPMPDAAPASERFGASAAFDSLLGFASGGSRPHRWPRR